MIIPATMCHVASATIIIVLTILAVVDGLSSSSSSSPPDESLENKSYHASHQCPTEFRDRCRCGLRTVPNSGPYLGHGRLTFVTNCTDANFTDSSATIIAHVPDETEVLIFTGNRFAQLNADLLSGRYEKLILVDLSRNGIESIHPDAFRNLSSVRTLILDDNRIKLDHSSPVGIFAPLVNLEELRLRRAFDDDNSMDAVLAVIGASNLTQLKVLDLGSNKLNSNIDGNVFCQMPQLRQLLLAHNRLESVNFDLRCLPDLRLLDISDNRIATVGNETIHELFGRGFFRVNISENPFRCDCHLKDFFRVLKNGSVKQHLEWLEELRCDDGRYLDQITDADLRCQHSFPTGEEISMVNLVSGATPPPEEKREAIRRYRRYITMSYIILAVLLAILSALIAVLIYTNREHLRTSWAILAAAGGASKRDYTQLSDGRTAPPGSSGSRRRKWWPPVIIGRPRKPVPPSLINYHPSPSATMVVDVAEEQV